MEQQSPETHQDGATAARTKQRGALEDSTPQNAAGESLPSLVAPYLSPSSWLICPCSLQGPCLNAEIASPCEIRDRELQGMGQRQLRSFQLKDLGGERWRGPSQGRVPKGSRR